MNAQQDDIDDEPTGPLHRWTVYYSASAGSSVTVEARSIEEAWDLAEQEFEQPTLCHSCAHLIDMGDWMPVEDEWGTTDDGPVDADGSGTTSETSREGGDV